MFKIESYRKGIIFSTIFNIFNKGLIFLNGLLVAHFFGSSGQSDLFFYVYSSVVILSSFFMSMNSTVLIPESMRLRIEQGEQASTQFLNSFFLIYATVLMLAMLAILIDPVDFFSLISSFKPEMLEANKHLIYLSIPIFGLSCMITLIVDILTSYKYFTISMIVGIVNGSLSIILILLLHNELGIQSAFIGQLAAYIINVILLLILMKRKINWKFSVSRMFISKRILKNAGLAQLGNLSSALSAYTPYYIISGFNPGVITALSFAQQISALPSGLITTQFSSVAGIKLNELYARSKNIEINQVFSDAANFLHFVMTPLSCIIFFYSEEIVAILVSLTNIHDNVASYMAVFMKYLGLLLPLLVSNTLIARLFMASHKIKEAFWFQLISNIVQVLSIWAAVKYFGAIGYPITLIIVYVLSTIFCYFLEKHHFNIISYDKILLLFLVFIVINGTLSFLIFLLLKQMTAANPWIILSSAFVAQYTLLLAVSRALKIDEAFSSQLNMLLNQLRNKLIFNKSGTRNGL